MPSALDRPIWQALRTVQADFAVGGMRARRFQSDVSPLAGVLDDSDESLAELAALIPPDESLILLQANESPVPGQAKVELVAEAVQMIAAAPLEAIIDERVVRLGDADAAEMLALAELTKPGPFLSRTHALGSFWGIRSNGRLAAMAGERLRFAGHCEVSGVCTHPDFRGLGYARILSQVVAAQIGGRGETAFLHAYAANEAAIGLYQSLGFTMRSEMVVTVLRRG